MADDVRTTCERCRRPEAEPTPANWTAFRAFDGELELPRDRCFTEFTRHARDAECDRLLLAERDALAEAGDRLAAWIDGLDLRHRAPGELHRWRSLRSPKGASDGD